MKKHRVSPCSQVSTNFSCPAINDIVSLLLAAPSPQQVTGCLSVVGYSFDEMGQKMGVFKAGAWFE